MKTFIVTGEREGGKTSFQINLYKELSKSDKNLCGFLSIGEIDKDNNKDFILHNLVSGENKHLASRNGRSNYEKYGDFYFNPIAIHYGNTIIAKALKKKCDIFMLDEIGPFELEGYVWHDSLKKIISCHQGGLIISVRRRLIKKTVAYFRMNKPVVFNIHEISPAEASKNVLSSFS